MHWRANILYADKAHFQQKPRLILDKNGIIRLRDITPTCSFKHTNMSTSAFNSPRTSEDGSTLCQSYGLCCTGVLHPHTVVDEDEVELANRLGLQLKRLNNGRLSFQQPCSCFQEGKCSVYTDRPRVCQRYQCKVLKEYVEGRITLAQGLARVKIARECQMKLQKLSGCAEDFESFRQCLPNTVKQQADWETIELRRQHSETLLAVATLRVILKKYFLARLPNQELPT